MSTSLNLKNCSCPFAILPPFPKQPLTCLFPLQINMYFLEFYINRNMYSFCLASFTQNNYFESYIFQCLSIVISFSIAEQHLIVWVYHNLFIHSLVDGHMGQLHFAVVTNKVASNICMHALNGCILSFLLGKCLAFKWLDHIVAVCLTQTWGFPGGSEVKVSAYNAEDLGSIPGLGRSPGEGNGNPLQYSCQENPMDRGTWWATVHGSQRVGHD